MKNSKISYRINSHPFINIKENYYLKRKKLLKQSRNNNEKIINYNINKENNNINDNNENNKFYNNINVNYSKININDNIKNRRDNIAILKKEIIYLQKVNNSYFKRIFIKNEIIIL